MGRLAPLFVLAACGHSEYPRQTCEQLAAARLDAASYAREDPRESLFADDRDAWKSSRCDPVRAALRPIDDTHDLEDATLSKECNEASARVDEGLRSSCRAGCWAERRHTAELAAWSRALKGVAAWDPKRIDMLALERSCPTMKTPPMTKDALGRALWMCAHLPLPPKRFHIGYQKRYRNGQPFGFDTMSVTLYDDEERHMREITYEECGGSGSRWAIFGRESP
jgi:hypothetical protein